MRKFTIPVNWMVSGFVSVEAESIQDAINDFKTHIDDYELPYDSEYVDDSFALSDDDPEFIALFNQ